MINNELLKKRRAELLQNHQKAQESIHQIIGRISEIDDMIKFLSKKTDESVVDNHKNEKNDDDS